jgi:hypothetical protein
MAFVDRRIEHCREYSLQELVLSFSLSSWCVVFPFSLAFIHVGL